MNRQSIQPKHIFQRLGNLHDATIKRADWLFGNRVFLLEIDDLYSSFEGMPEYPGRQAAFLAFYQTEEICIRLENIGSEEVRIYGIHTKESIQKRKHQIEITLTPAGSISIQFDSFEVFTSRELKPEDRHTLQVPDIQ